MNKETRDLPPAAEELESHTEPVELSRSAKNFEIYKELEEKVESHKQLQKLLDGILESGLRYSNTISTLSRVSKYKDLEYGESKTIEESDKARRKAHNAMVDQMNIFCRACSREKLDIDLLYDIVAMGDQESRRSKIAQFVLDVLDQIALERDKEEKERSKQ